MTNSSPLFPPKLFIKKLNTQILSKYFALKFARELSKGWFRGGAEILKNDFVGTSEKAFATSLGFMVSRTHKTLPTATESTAATATTTAATYGNFWLAV